MIGSASPSRRSRSRSASRESHGNASKDDEDAGEDAKRIHMRSQHFANSEAGVRVEAS
jgi:hypothetical protein